MTITHHFTDSKAKGEDLELSLDFHFAQWFTVAPATAQDQRRGIDRYFTADNGFSYLVEYKSDNVAGRTGNAFIETVSVARPGLPPIAGWAHTSQATMLIYWVTHPSCIYCIPMRQVRHHLPDWEKKYKTQKVLNDGYLTHGILVPLDELERIAIAVY